MPWGASSIRKEGPPYKHLSYTREICPDPPDGAAQNPFTRPTGG